MIARAVFLHFTSQGLFRYSHVSSLCWIPTWRITHETRVISGSPDFPRGFSVCFARCRDVYLHLRTVPMRNAGLDPQEMGVHADVHED